MEPLWSPVAATGRNQRQIHDESKRQNKPKRLPSVASDCLRRSMVRRASTVRVRQRALQSHCKSAEPRAVGGYGAFKLKTRPPNCDLGDLADACPDRSRCSRYDHSLARPGLTDLEQGEIGRQTIEAEDAKRCGDRQTRAADLALDRLGVHHSVVLPAEHASQVLARVEIRTSRLFDAPRPTASKRMTPPSATGSE